ncbi:MAG TPA: anti-sigma factor [Anaerolineaceae bacterium]|nr:anti-sigma factor [Anaerolineaceae bacterium]
MSKHQYSPQCKQLLGSISQYIDGELEAELCAVLEAHLEDCENCRIVVNTLRKTVELYKETEPEAELPGEVRQRLFLKLQLEDYRKKP